MGSFGHEALELSAIGQRIWVKQGNHGFDNPARTLTADDAYYSGINRLA
jgi:hypothetical protein